LGIAEISDPLGGAVGGEDGMAGTAGKEYISVLGASCGAVDHGSAFSPSGKAEDEPGIAGGGAPLVICGANEVAPASDAAIARKSASFKAAAGGDNGGRGRLGTAGTFGTPENENISRG
jgi:hypothetical protein